MSALACFEAMTKVQRPEENDAPASSRYTIGPSISTYLAILGKCFSGDRLVYQLEACVSENIYVHLHIGRLPNWRYHCAHSRGDTKYYAGKKKDVRCGYPIVTITWTKCLEHGCCHARKKSGYCHNDLIMAGFYRLGFLCGLNGR